MNLRTSLSILVAAGLTGLAPAAALGQSYTVSWSSIDGGGVMQAVAGPYRLGGTAGQPDAGPALITPGPPTRKVDGGFWAIGASNPPPPCVADFNGDGNLDPDDLGDYINCYFALPPCPQADFNADGNVDPDDLGDYINSYFSGCP